MRAANALRGLVLCAVAAFASLPVGAQQLTTSPPPDPAAILGAAKLASGGAAWDALESQHSKVAILSGSLTGVAERWSEVATGRSYLRYSLGPVAGTMGYDGTVSWSHDASGASRVESAEAAHE